MMVSGILDNFMNVKRCRDVEMSRERRIDPTGSVEGGNGKAS